MGRDGVDRFAVETGSIDNLTLAVQVSYTLSPVVVHVTSCDFHASVMSRSNAIT